jgi:hypothetical protein
MSRRQSREGYVVRTLDELIALLDSGQYLYWHGRAYHPGWVRSWQFGMVRRECGRGLFRAAVTLDGRPFIGLAGKEPRK